MSTYDFSTVLLQPNGLPFLESSLSGDSKAELTMAAVFQHMLTTQVADIDEKLGQMDADTAARARYKERVKRGELIRRLETPESVELDPHEIDLLMRICGKSLSPYILLQIDNKFGA